LFSKTVIAALAKWLRRCMPSEMSALVSEASTPGKSAGNELRRREMLLAKRRGGEYKSEL
jgi:hypothetical protein